MKMRNMILTVAVFIVASSAFANSQMVAYIESMPASYGFRAVCVDENQVVGLFSTAKNWANSGKIYLAQGDLTSFPKTRTEFNPRGLNSVYLKYEMPKGPEDWKRFKVIKASANGSGDTIYLTVGSITSGVKTTKALCAFENGPRLE